MCGCRTLWKGLVRDVDGVHAPFRNLRAPLDCRRTLLSMLYGLDLSGGAVVERRVEPCIYRFCCGESGACIRPSAVFRIFGCAVAYVGRIIVGDDLIPLYIPFSRDQYICSGVFQHRNEVRQDIALGVHVLDRLEKRRSLPLPAVGAYVVVISVALPYGDMSSVHSTAEFHAFERCHDVPAVRVLRTVPCLVGIAVEVQRRGYEVVEADPLAVDLSQPVFLIAFRKKRLEGVPEPSCLTCMPGIVAKGFRKVEVKVGSALHYSLEPELTLDGIAFLDQDHQRITDRLEILYDLTLARGTESEDQGKGCYDDESFHFLSLV